MSLISIRNVSKSFDKLEVLKGISFDVEEGEVVCLIGPSGSGKSTLLRCINMLETIDDGEIEVMGENIHHLRDINHYRQRVGMVFQQFNLFNNMNTLDNCMLAQLKVLKRNKEEAKRIAIENLNKVGLGDFIYALPSTLSGGQKQRVAIAGVIAMQPKIIVLDEPTAMLDPQGRAEVVSTVSKLCREKGMTVILITHHMDECVDADRLIVMSNGRVVADGSPEKVFSMVELMEKEGLTVPETTRVLYELRGQGIDVPLDALRVEDCARAIAAEIG